MTIRSLPGGNNEQRFLRQPLVGAYKSTALCLMKGPQVLQVRMVSNPMLMRDVKDQGYNVSGHLLQDMSCYSTFL